MDNVEYVLAHLKLRSLGKAGPLSYYADSILEFWMFGPQHKFSINARVFKPGMDLAGYIREWAKCPTVDNSGGEKP